MVTAAAADSRWSLRRPPSIPSGRAWDLEAEGVSRSSVRRSTRSLEKAIVAVKTHD